MARRLGNATSIRLYSSARATATGEGVDCGGKDTQVVVSTKGSGSATLVIQALDSGSWSTIDTLAVSSKGDVQRSRKITSKMIRANITAISGAIDVDLVTGKLIREGANSDGFNVKDYGVLESNSGAANSAAFQSACDAVSSGYIVVPAGTYEVDLSASSGGQAFTITTSNTYLVLEPGAVIKLADNQIQASPPNTTPIIRFGDGSNPYENVGVMGPGTIDGNITGQSAAGDPKNVSVFFQGTIDRPYIGGDLKFLNGCGRAVLTAGAGRRLIMDGFSVKDSFEGIQWDFPYSIITNGEFENITDQDAIEPLTDADYSVISNVTGDTIQGSFLDFFGCQHVVATNWACRNVENAAVDIHNGSTHCTIDNYVIEDADGRVASTGMINVGESNTTIGSGEIRDTTGAAAYGILVDDAVTDITIVGKILIDGLRVSGLYVDDASAEVEASGITCQNMDPGTTGANESCIRCNAGTLWAHHNKLLGGRFPIRATGGTIIAHDNEVLAVSDTGAADEISKTSGDIAAWNNRGAEDNSNANTETLSGDKTLEGFDAGIQSLDGGASNRNIDLPAEEIAENLQFYISNTGSTNNLVVRNDAAATITTLTPGNASWLRLEGGAWTAH